MIIDLYSRKVISWCLSSSPSVELVLSAFKKAYALRNEPYGLIFHSVTGVRSILLLLSVIFWIPYMLCSHFQKRDTLSATLSVRLSLNTLKRRKLIAELTTLLKNFGCPFLNTLKGTITPDGLIALSVILLPMKWNTPTGLLILLNSSCFCVYSIDYTSLRAL